MSIIDVKSLLSPLDQAGPCGPSLQYGDEAYAALEQAARGVPAKQAGKEVLPGKDPNWRAVAEQAEGVLKRTKDLRVYVYLTAARLGTHGFAGLRDGLRLLREAVEQYWEHIHPTLDPSDGNDPVERANIVAQLAAGPAPVGEGLRIVDRLRETPLTEPGKFGRVGLRHVSIARGETRATEDELREGRVPDTASNDAAFDQTPIATLTALADDAGGAAAELRLLDEAFTQRAGAGHAPNLDRLRRALDQALSELQKQLARRGIGDAAAAASGEPAAAAGGPARGKARLSGEITCREDVVLALEKICGYYELHEPSSPIPMLLRRARGLVGKSFIDIVVDLTPGAMNEVVVHRGKSESGGAS